MTDRELAEYLEKRANQMDCNALSEVSKMYRMAASRLMELSRQNKAKSFYYNEYIGLSDNGLILCEGNSNARLSYHVTDLYNFITGYHPLPLCLNKETMRMVCKKWNRQTRGTGGVKVKPYKVRFTMEVIESSRKSRSKKAALAKAAGEEVSDGK